MFVLPRCEKSPSTGFGFYLLCNIMGNRSSGHFGSFIFWLQDMRTKIGLFNELACLQLYSVKKRM